jgi:hypothetical protein
MNGQSLCNILGVDARLLFASIAGNAGGWEAYNVGDNRGELMSTEQLERKGFQPRCGSVPSKL